MTARAKGFSRGREFNSCPRLHLRRGFMVTFSGIYLTWARPLNYRCRVSAMKRDSDLRLEFSEPRKRAAVCLVLVALLLYNPFFTILGSSLDLSVQHPLSYRATLASTELQRGMLEAANPLISGLDAAILHAFSLFSLSHKVAFVQPSDAVTPMSQAICDNIWFRPPPSA
jgi:hypothetical protein